MSDKGKYYDGWTVKKTPFGGRSVLNMHYLRKTREQVVMALENTPGQPLKTLEEKRGFKIVKVKLVEVE